jgi:hypothetical protein
MTSPFPRGTIIVYADSSIWNTLICFGSGGRWDHVAMALGDGTAIQCSPFRGVNVAPDMLQEKLMTFPYPGDVERAINFYQTCLQHGDRYDFLGLFANPLYNLSQRTYAMPMWPGMWNCATLMAAPMVSDPAVKLLDKPLSTFTPNDFAVMFDGK